MNPYSARINMRGKIARVFDDCTKRLADLSLPPSCDIDTFRDILSARRGRPIRLISVAMQATQPCGLWIARRAEDLVVYEAETTPPHQKHIIVHEFSHMICDHRSILAMNDLNANYLFPTLSPELVRHMLQRSGYSDSQEVEAEVMASLILPALSERMPNCEDPALAALGAALGIRQVRREW